MNDSLFTWGWGKYGQLGHGDELESDTPRPLDRVLLQGQAIAQVSCGFCYNIALTSRGDIYTWGHGKYFQLGSDNRNHQNIPRKIKFFMKRKVKCVGAGREHTVAVLETGQVYTWGSGAYGRLGHGNEETCREPRLIEYFEAKVTEEEKEGEESEESASVTIIVAVECGSHHTLALDSRGRVFSWGLGLFGRLGHGNEKDQFVPKLIDALVDQHIQVALVRCGWDHSAVVTAGKGHVYTFGDGRSFQLGGIGLGGGSGQSSSGSSMCIMKPTKVMQWNHEMTKKNFATGKFSNRFPRIIDLSCGGKHNLALTDKGTVYSWGRGEFGRLGHCDQKHRAFPCLVECLVDAKIISIAAGGYHSFALTDEGILYAWGNNEHGRLGLGDKGVPYIAKPIVVPITKSSAKSRQSFHKVFAGAYVSMALGEHLDNNNNNGRCSVM